MLSGDRSKGGQNPTGLLSLSIADNPVNFILGKMVLQNSIDRLFVGLFFSRLFNHWTNIALAKTLIQTTIQLAPNIANATYPISFKISNISR